MDDFIRSENRKIDRRASAERTDEDQRKVPLALRRGLLVVEGSQRSASDAEQRVYTGPMDRSLHPCASPRATQ